MTGKLWQSGFVAAMFAFHPINVESVAWAAERKNVLSTLFWLMTMWAYIHYAEKPTVKRYGLVFLFFTLLSCFSYKIDTFTHQSFTFLNISALSI